MLVFLLFFAFSVGEIRAFERKKAHNAVSYSFQFLLHFKETASGKDDVVPIELSRRNSHYSWCILCFASLARPSVSFEDQFTWQSISFMPVSEPFKGTPASSFAVAPRHSHSIFRRYSVRCTFARTDGST